MFGLVSGSCLVKRLWPKKRSRVGMEGAAVSTKTGEARTAGASNASAEDHSEPIESRARGLPKAAPYRSRWNHSKLNSTREWVVFR